MDIVVEGVLNLALALKAFSTVLKAPQSYLDELDRLSERVYGAIIVETAPSEDADENGDGSG